MGMHETIRAVCGAARCHDSCYTTRESERFGRQLLCVSLRPGPRLPQKRLVFSLAAERKHSSQRSSGGVRSRRSSG